jgi:hypothetical protein
MLLLLAADPGGAQAEVAELAGGEVSLLAADFGGVEGEPGRRARAEDAQEAVLFEAFFEVVAFRGGEVEIVEAFASGEGAGRAHGYFALDHARSIDLTAGELGAEVWLASDGYVGAHARRPEDVPAHGTTGVDAPDLTQEQSPPYRSCRARICPRRSKQFEFTITPLAYPIYCRDWATVDEAAADSRNGPGKRQTIREYMPAANLELTN